jgi:hypothetical protein
MKSMDTSEVDDEGKEALYNKWKGHISGIRGVLVARIFFPFPLALPLSKPASSVPQCLL